MLDLLEGAALRTLLLAGVLQCAFWLLRVRHARLLLMAWTFVLAASVAMPALPWVIPVQLPLDAALPGLLIDDASELVQRPVPQASPADAVPGPQASPSPGSWLQAAYVAVACGMALRVLLGVGLSVRMVARAVRVRPRWAAGCHVRLSRDVTGPVTVGRVILLPVDAVGWSCRTRRAVLAHEGAHVARRDFALLVVSQLNRALFWFSPVSWWLHHRLVGLTELASDDQAIALTRDRLGYAEVLLEMGRRCGRVSRDVAMARPSTLPSRIDRILLDQASSCCISRPRQVLLTGAVTGLSLGIASLVPGQVPIPATSLPAQQQDTTGPALDVSEVGGSVAPDALAVQAPARDGASTTAAAAVPDATGAGPARGPASSVPPAVAPDMTAVRRPRAAVLPVARPALRMPRRGTSALQASGVEERASQGGIGPGETASALRGIDREDAAPHLAGGPGTATTRGPIAEEVGFPPPPGLAYGVAPYPGSTGTADSVCNGTIALGSRAWREMSWPNKHPDIVAGQTVPAQARFFHRVNGTLWVRFNAFGRPSLDLPVHLTRNGMTWTGEYGIAYTVRASGRDHLAGLASEIAHDSAMVEFACRRAASIPS